LWRTLIDFQYFSLFVSLLSSLIALGISIVSLWKAYFAPFRLEIACEAPTLTLYKITPEMSESKVDLTWWVPSFFMGISFTNVGQRTGQVIDVRILAEITSKGKPQKYAFFAKWVVDYASFMQNRENRFAWMKRAVKRNWYPLILRGGETKTLHLILEPISEWYYGNKGMMKLYFQIFSSEEKRWLEIAQFWLEVDKDLYETGRSVIAYDSRLEDTRYAKT